MLITTSNYHLQQSLILTTWWRNCYEIYLNPNLLFLASLSLRHPNICFFSKTKYTKEIIDRVDMYSYKLTHTPIDTNPKLPTTSNDPFLDPTFNSNIIRALQYPSFTCPNIFYVMQQLSLHMHERCTLI